MRFGEHIAGEGDLAGAHGRFWVEIDRPGLSRFRQGLVYSSGIVSRDSMSLCSDPCPLP